MVTSDGRVYAFRRDKLDSFNSNRYNGGIEELKQQKSNKGYMRVYLNNKLILVHKLIALAFLGNRPAGFQIDHINRDSCDNRLENLRYVTPHDNLINRSIHDTSISMTDRYCTKRNGKYVVLHNSERRRIK
jgi:hypothetical protein